MKVLFVSHRFDHMGAYSGYDRLGFYLKQNERIELVTNKKITRNRFQKKLIDLKVGSLYNPEKYGLFHNYNHYVTEHDAVKQSVKENAGIIHLAYLEDSLGYISDNRSKIKTKIVATAHQPPVWWIETKKNTEILKSLDALIVLSIESKIFFEKIIPGKVFFVPHGIDTRFFSAYRISEKSNNKKRCLFVGNWLRDFNTFAETVSLINDTSDNIEFDIVFPHTIESTHPLYSLIKYPNVHWYKNIDDHALLSLYRNATALFLPLLASTANNALLEAASCEVPVITNKGGGAEDYLKEQFVYFAEERSPACFLEKINFVFNSANAEKIYINSKMQKVLIAEKFSWEVIASEIIKLYQSI